MKSTLPVLPSEDTAKAAQEAARKLSPLLKHKPGQKVTLRARAKEAEISIEVPFVALKFFVQILAEMANGHAITIVPVHTELTTQQAAELLNVSRPYLVGLLEEEKIPFHRVGTHRRVRFVDLLAYKEKDDDERKRVLAELAAEAQKHKLGY